MSARTRRAPARARTRRAALTLAAGIAAGTWFTAVLAVIAASASHLPDHVDETLSAHDLSLQRAALGLAPLLAHEPRPALVVVSAPHALAPAESDALRAYVEAGGTAWLLLGGQDTAPLRLGSTEVRLLPGLVFHEDGSAPRLAEPAAGEDAFGWRALDVVGESTALVVASADAYRDTNGNARLDLGEPAGPFTLAARIPVGEGALLVAARDGLADLSPAILEALAAESASGAGILLDLAGAPAWHAPVRASALAFLLAASDAQPAAALAGVGAAAFLVLLLRSVGDAPAASSRLGAIVERFRGATQAAPPQDALRSSAPPTKV